MNKIKAGGIGTGISILGVVLAFVIPVYFPTPTEVIVNVPDQSIIEHSLAKPIAEIVGPGKVSLGEVVKFQGDSSKDLDGFIEKWEWYVDGNLLSNEAFFSHTFSKIGTSTVELLITDDDGQKDRALKVVDVSNTQEKFEGSVEIITSSFGPTKYSSFNDSPFREYKQNSVYFYLEDFEDGVLNTPGVSSKNGIVLSPNKDNSIHIQTTTDSVDIDDGLADGLGYDGYSFFSESSHNEIVFTFNENQLKQLPNFVGLVLTDEDCNRCKPFFEAYGVDGLKIDSVGPSSLSGNGYGKTDDDRFFGIATNQDIKGIKIQSGSDSRMNIEIDHLQYGRIAN